MKECSYCNKEAQDDAVYCPYCGKSFAGDEKPVKWYFRTAVIVIAVFCVGPLALPLVWFNPHYGSKVKVISTVAVLILTYLTIVATMEAFKSLNEYYELMFQQM